MLTFVLVHGSWHDGSAWNAVVPRLEELGHVAHSPTVAGHGKGVDKAVTHDDCVRSVQRFVVDRDLADVVLVGHSFGGSVIARVAEEIPERLRRLVFWNAFVPRPGTSVEDDLPPHYRELFAELARGSGDNTVMLPFPIWREAFIQDAGLDRATAAYRQLSPTPYRPFLDRLDLSRFSRLEIAKSFLNCTDDTALPPGEWGWHPKMSGRLGLHRLVQLPGSHEVVFTNPRLLAEKIVHAGRD